MDNGSAVEYWERFSQHAFDHAESGVNMSVILMSPTSRPVPCSFCFTLKRDIFDLPSVVVGNVSYPMEKKKSKSPSNYFHLVFTNIRCKQWIKFRLSLNGIINKKAFLFCNYFFYTIPITRS